MNDHAMTYRPDVDGLRGVAVLSVLAFHAFPAQLPGGFVGVDVFFVISGYLISGIILAETKRGTFTFSGFYARRIRRIFPALFTVLACCLLYGWLMLLPHDYAELGGTAAGGAGFVSNFVLLAQSGYFAAAANARPLLHLWSLGVEEQYYLCWPMILWFSGAGRARLILIATLALGSFAWNLLEIRWNTSAAFYLPQTRFWELLAGAWLAAAESENGPIVSGSLRSTMSYGGALILAASVLLINEDRAFPGWWALLPTTGSFLLIAAGPGGWMNRRVLGNPALVWVGLISYPLYLWHWPIISMASLYHGEFPPRNWRIVIVVLSLVLAWATYVLIEKPIRSRKRGAAKVAVAVLLALMAAIGSYGYVCYLRDGYPDRFPPRIRQIDAITYANGHESAWREKSCFLELDQSSAAFAACDGTGSRDKPVLLLWGDSLAAQLAPGYRSVFGEKYSIVQRTASACAPIFDDAYNRRLAHCDEINAYIMQTATESKPDRVVLSARWSVHDWPRVAQTIEKLRQGGVRRIDLVGPVPRWRISLPRQLILLMQSTKSESFPQRTNFGLDRSAGDLEPALRRLAAQEGANFLSPMSILCDEQGCLTRTGEEANTITSFDYDHLSQAASVFVVSRFPED